MKITPIGDRLVVKCAKVEEKTVAGIVLPDVVNQEEKAEGVIVAIGEGEKIIKLKLEVGNNILFVKYTGDDFEDGDNKFKIIKQDDILAVVED